MNKYSAIFSNDRTIAKSPAGRQVWRYFKPNRPAMG